MTPQRRWWLTLAAASLALAAAGCARNAEVNRSQHADGNVAFAEATSIEITPEREPDVVSTLILINRGAEPVTVTRVQPIADRGLTVWYLGHTTCKSGCAGDGLWTGPNADRELAEQSIEGTVPFTLAPDGDRRLSLVFHYAASDLAAEARLRDGCVLRMRSVRLTLDSGKTVRASGPNNHVVALAPPSDDPPAGGAKPRDRCVG